MHVAHERPGLSWTPNAELEADQPVQKPLDKRFVLFGIVINGSEKKALVANLDRKNATGKEYVWVKAGDKIGNLNVSEIQPEQIIITQGGNTYTIRLSDHNHPQKRAIGRKRKNQLGRVRQT